MSPEESREVSTRAILAKARKLPVDDAISYLTGVLKVARVNTSFYRTAYRMYRELKGKANQ